MGVGNFFQSRFKLQLLCASLLAVTITLAVICQRRNVYYYQQLSLIGKFRSTNRTNVTLKALPTRKYIITANYNLMDEKEQLFDNFDKKTCTLDYMNANKLPQDHPCVIENIRKHYLNKPPPSDAPLKLDSHDLKDRSPGQTGVIFRILKNQTNGFFVDCGAHNGEFLSNTLDLERKFNWSGILIEANPEVFKKLLSRNRKAWTLPICLSLEPFPTRVSFQPKSVDPGHSHIEGAAETLQKPGIPGVDPDLVTVQCFPFYSVLLAVGRTQIDFFSLDVEGHELNILKTIPWHKVGIKTLTIEWDNIPEGEEALSRLMEKNGFIKIGEFDFKWTRDVIFIKDLINI